MKNSPKSLFVVAPPGLEECCCQEMDRLQLRPGKPVSGGIPMVGGLTEIYRANLHLRTASRILVELGSFVARDFPSLYQRALNLPWGSFVLGGEKLEIRVSTRTSRLNHSRRVAETIEAAITDSLGPEAGAGRGESQMISVRLEDDRCHFSVDSSGDLLHRRGYRQVATKAPLRENLAAGLLLRLDWAIQEHLVDPFCGSGTLVIEAAEMAMGFAAGRRRKFRFMQWPGFRQGLWRQLCQLAQRNLPDNSELLLLAADKNPDAIEAARHNASAAGVCELIEFRTTPLSELSLPTRSGLLIGNPPYGLRLDQGTGDGAAVQQLVKRLDVDLADWCVGLICPEKPPGKGWRSLTRLRNGGLAVQLWCREGRGGKGRKVDPC